MSDGGRSIGLGIIAAVFLALSALVLVIKWRRRTQIGVVDDVVSPLGMPLLFLDLIGI